MPTKTKLSDLVLSRHVHAPGTKVTIYNGFVMKDNMPVLKDGQPVPLVEGVAKIVSKLNVDNYYRVRFPGDRKTYARFVQDDAVVK